MNDFKERMKERTLNVAEMVIGACDQLPATPGNTAIIGYLTRSIISVGANYREACRARSRADFISKMQIAEAECDESLYWIEVIEARHDTPLASIREVRSELNAILAILVKAVKTAKGVSG